MSPKTTYWSIGPFAVMKKEFPQGTQWSFTLEETLVVVSEEMANRLIKGDWVECATVIPAKS